jgi:sensor domain CHASE-containing protein
MNLNEKTTIPIWAVFASIPALVGGIMWLSFIAYTSNTSASEIADIKLESKEINKEVRLQLIQINDRLTRIETKLDSSKEGK